MSQSQVEPDELHTHATHLRTIHERFEAVKNASAHIGGGDEAYGTLCAFFPRVLHDRHTAQDELVREIAFNIISLAGAVTDSADEYEAADKQNASTFDAINSSIEDPVAQ